MVALVFGAIIAWLAIPGLAEFIQSLLTGAGAGV